jgi:polyphosphate kinase
MHRNIYERVEVMFHMRDAELCKQVFGEVIEPYLADTEKTRIMLADGRYVRAGEAGTALHSRNGFRFNAQEFLIALAEGRETIGKVPRPPSFVKLAQRDKSVSSV